MLQTTSRRQVLSGGFDAWVEFASQLRAEKQWVAQQQREHGLLGSVESSTRLQRVRWCAQEIEAEEGKLIALERRVELVGAAAEQAELREQEA